MGVSMTVVAENSVTAGIGLIGEHGFCAHIESEGKRVLWDTGQGFALPHNAPRLGVDLKKIDVIALSHGHFDHTGGLPAALAPEGERKIVCHPACFEKKMTKREMFGKTIEAFIGAPTERGRLESMGARFSFVEDSVEIAPGVHFITAIPMKNDFENIEAGFFIQKEGEKVHDDFRDDAALAIETDAGVSVILGCAHRGVVNTLERVMDMFGVKSINSVWGGTHMIDRTPEEVEKTIEALKAMNVGLVAAAHCTGLENEAKLAAALPGKFAFASVGVRAVL